jgi:membrane-associated phospholipid phosphatase
MTRSESLSSKSNWIRAISVAGLVACGYFFPNHVVLFPTHPVALTVVDQWIPLSPVWIWFYISYYAILMAAYFVNTGSSVQRFYVDAILVAAATGFLIFIFFPTSISRDLYPWLGPSDYSSGMLAKIRGADNSVNCLPSMHICMGFIAAYALALAYGRVGRVLVWLWFLAICYSTMATKQHYFVDVVSGFALGVTCVGIFLKRYGLLPDFSGAFKTNA